ncbi:hypothetical protein [Streptomyces sp. NPDC058385]|uniref:hypothetical protein n=1 Tax=Streptomyces sp. NPDC058385 TaxID=3346473 RepID=UPI003666C659
MTLIYAFKDVSGQWHGEPDTPLTDPADEPSRGWLTYQPVPGTPEANSPFAGQTLAVLYGVTDLEPGPVTYQLDSGGRFQATWHVHTLLATPMGSALIPQQRHDLAPCPEASLTENDRYYTLSTTRAEDGRLATEITITSHYGEIQAELRGTLDYTDLQPLARLLHSTAPAQTSPARPPSGAPDRRPGGTWPSHESNRLATRFREERDFGILAQEFNRHRGEIYLHLLHLGLISEPAGQRRPQQPAPKPAPSPILEQRRLEHRNSHARWTEPEEVHLARRCADGVPAAQLSQEFGRSELAIEARLLKIGAEGPAADQARINAL